MEIRFKNHIENYNFSACLKRLYKEKKNISDLTKRGIFQDIARDMFDSGIIVYNSKDSYFQKEQVQNVASILRNHLKVESAENISGQWLLIYTEYFDCSMDYLIGKIDTFKHDTIDATTKTGLSEKAIEIISGYDDSQKELIEDMATADNDILKYLLNILFLTSLGMHQSTITINNGFGLDTTVPANETKSFVLASAQNEFNEIITAVYENIYRPRYDELSNLQYKALKEELIKAKGTE